jgi:hypothetical protein
VEAAKTDPYFFSIPDSEFAMSLLELPKGSLSTRWQVALLKANVSLEATESKAVLSKLEDGLRHFDKPEDIMIKGAIGDILKDFVRANLYVEHKISV